MWKGLLGFLLGVGKKILQEIWAFIKSIALKEAISLKNDALTYIVAAEQLRHDDGTVYEWEEKFTWVVKRLIAKAELRGLEHAKTSAIIALQICYEELRVALEKIRGEGK